MAQRKPSMRIPPNGFAGSGQQTPAVQTLVNRALRKKVRRKRKAKKRATSTRRRSPTRRKKKKTGRLKKGSPAAKRHMAQLRKMQKRRRR